MATTAACVHATGPKLSPWTQHTSVYHRHELKCAQPTRVGTSKLSKCPQNGGKDEFIKRETWWYIHALIYYTELQIKYKRVWSPGPLGRLGLKDVTRKGKWEWHMGLKTPAWWELADEATCCPISQPLLHPARPVPRAQTPGRMPSTPLWRASQQRSSHTLTLPHLGVLAQAPKALSKQGSQSAYNCLPLKYEQIDKIKKEIKMYK